MGWLKKFFGKLDKAIRAGADISILYSAIFGAGGLLASLGLAKFLPLPAAFSVIKPEWAAFLLKFTLSFALFLVCAVVGLLWLLWREHRDIARYRSAEMHFINLAILNAETDVQLFARLVQLLRQLQTMAVKLGWGRRNLEALNAAINDALRDALGFAKQNITENLNAAGRMVFDTTNARTVAAAYVLRAGTTNNDDILERLETDENSRAEWQLEELVSQNELALKVLSGTIPYYQSTHQTPLTESQNLGTNLMPAKGLVVVPIKNFDAGYNLGKKVIGIFYIKSRDGDLGAEVAKNYGLELSARLSVMFYRVDTIRNLLPSESTSQLG